MSTTLARIDLIEEAAALIDAEAAILRAGHTLPTDLEFPPEEAEVERDHNALQFTALRLYNLADELRREIGQPVKVPAWIQGLAL